MTRFYMIRHGQTDENKAKHIQGRRDIPLNSFGEAQARMCGNFLKKYKFDMAFCSPLSRARRTLEIILEELGSNLNIIPDERFIERSFGVMEGALITEENFRPIIAETSSGLELSKDIQKRVCDALIDIALKNPNKDILVVSHSHTIKAVTTAVDKKYRFDDKLYNCALTIIEVENKDINILDFNIKTID